MRKYWYYTYRTINFIGFGISYSDNGEFDVLSEIKYLQEKNGINTLIVINSWQEISSTQYEKLNNYLNETNGL